MTSLLTEGANVEAQSHDGIAPLFVACYLGHADVVERLLAGGANIETHSMGGGTTPLSIACEEGHLDVVEMLMAAGAQIDAPNKDGTTALFVACQEGYVGLVERLIAAGVSIELRSHGEKLLNLRNQCLSKSDGGLTTTLRKESAPWPKRYTRCAPDKDETLVDMCLK